MLIAQLSDPHLRPDGQLYQGLVDSNTMFAAAVRCLNALDPLPDIVLISGDLVDEGSEAEYACARQALAALRPPLFVIPGNHDHRERFRACFQDHAYIPRRGPLHYVIGNHGPVRIIALDVTVPGDHHGDLDDDAAHWLETALAEEPDRPTLIMMHHPPFDSGIAGIDAYHCRNGEWLAAIVRRHPQVERIVCGHVHRFMQLRFGGTMLVTAPSTTTAIALRLAPDAEPASFIEPPALLLHHWHPASGLITHLLPIGHFPGPLAFF